MQSQKGRAYLALSAATLAFAANFSVWVLYAVAGIELKSTLGLSTTEFGVLLAAPMLTGAIFRLPVGFLVEKYGTKPLFVIQMLLTMVPLWLLQYATRFNDYILLGLWLGIAGVSFTIGIRYVVDWFDSKQQGTAMGIFGAGNAGAAITLILAPKIIELFGFNLLGPVYACGMFIVAVLFAVIAPSSPPYIQRRTKFNWAEHTKPLKELKVWRFGVYYYFVFGSYLALTLWLPHYYVSAYQLSISQAMALTLLYVASSSLVRAAGGVLADRYGARSVNWSVFWTCIICLFFLSYPPTTMVIEGVNKDVMLKVEVNVWLFTGLIFIIGIAQGFGRASIYKIIYDYYPNNMGSVGGTVAMVGALGGCSLPLLFGFVTDLIGVHSAIFMLLYGVIAVCMLLMYFANQQEGHARRVKQARDNNFLERE